MELIRQVAAVIAVLALLAVTLWWLWSRGPALALARRPARRKLECVEHLPLGPQHTLHLIRLGDQALIVASSPSGCALVRSLAWRELEDPKLETVR
jgi:flagellar biogenesis protein FliO